MNDLVHYLRYISCTETVDVPSVAILADVQIVEQEAHPQSKKPTHGERIPPTGQESPSVSVL